jgi:DNA helicase-2/ATP-dependent DNA helicase PcrA
MNDNKLTEEQARAVDHDLDEDLLIVAAPGSGKTRTLVARISRALSKGRRITAITFTNNAARELRQRIIATGFDSIGSFVGTVHSLAIKFASENPEKLRFLRNGFTFLDDESLSMVVADCAESIRYKPTRKELVEVLQMDPRTIFVEKVPRAKREVWIRTVWNVFRTQNGWPFDAALWEFIPNASSLEPSLLFVDECQDTGPAEGQIFDQWNSPRTFVGDPRQAIYSFRGASLAVIEKAMETIDVLELARTFRFGCDIGETANDIMEGSDLPALAPIVTDDGSSPGDVIVRGLACPAEEISHTISILQEAVANKQTAAVLLRSNALVKEYGEQIKAAIPEVWISGTSDDPEEAREARLLGLLAAFAVNPFSPAAAMSLAVVSFTREDVRASIGSAEIRRSLSERLRAKYGLIEISAFRTAGALGEYLRSQARLPQIKNRIGWVVEAVGCNEPPALMLPGLGGQLRAKEENELPRIVVMTMHGAKGLEFDSVIIPAQELRGNRSDHEEERRLLYVAATRAKSSLAITWSKTRTLYDGGRLEPREPSEYVAQIIRKIEEAKR